VKTAEQRIAAAWQQSRKSVELARYLSLASRISSPLLRHFRLKFMRRSGPELEAEVWFSPLVGVRSARGVLFYPDVAAELRRQLPGKHRIAVRGLLSKTEQTRPPLVRLEEELVWLGLKYRGDSDEEALNERLRSIVKALIEQDRKGLGRWALAALSRIPELEGLTSAVSLDAISKRRLSNERPTLDNEQGTRLSREERLILLREGSDLSIDAGRLHGQPMTHRDIAQTASKWGQIVARTLGLNKAGDPVRSLVRREFQLCLDTALQMPDKSAESQLLAIVRRIRWAPELQASLALMESFWRLPSGSQLESDVVRVIQRCYVDCRERKPVEFERLDNALRESQWSPFPAVRQVAHKVQQMVPVGANEIRFLKDFDHGYTDLLLAIVDRALRHKQLEHLDEVLLYMTSVLTRGSANQEEINKVRVQFRLLRGFSTSTEFLLQIFKHYQANYYRSSDVRGRLMPVLSDAGDSLVPGLVTFWQQADSESARAPIVRLLQQMIEFGRQTAVDALGDIVWKSRGTELQFAHRCLLEGASSQAARGMSGHWSRLIRQSLDKLIERLDESFEPEHIELREQLRQLPWEANADRQWVRKIIAEGFIDKDLKRLRSAGYLEYEILKSTIVDLEATVDNRRHAMTALGYLNSEHVQRMGVDFLWQLYEEEPDLELRCATLRTLKDLEFQPEDWMIYRLFHDQENAEPKLRQTINEVWEGFVVVSPQPPPEEILQKAESDASQAGDRARTESDHLSHPGRLKIVLCRLPENRPQARNLYQQLKDDGFQAWLADEDLLPGQSQETEIARQIRECDAVVALLGAAFHRQAGLEHQIIKWALEAQRKQPPDSIFLIPALVEECEVPDNFRDLAPVRLFEEGGYKKLKRSLQAREKQLLRSVSG
jgi:hypothetical protein